MTIIDYDYYMQNLMKIIYAWFTLGEHAEKSIRNSVMEIDNTGQKLYISGEISNFFSFLIKENKTRTQKSTERV